MLVDDELDGPGGLVVDGFCERHRLLAHGLARVRIEERGRGFLDNLLVAALDRTFALIEPEAITVGVGQHLDLDMARLLDEFLDEDAVVAEGGGCLGFRAIEALARLGVVPSNAHALAAAAGGCLDHHRIADLGGNLHGVVGILDQTHEAGHGGNARVRRNLLRGDLVAHRFDGFRLRPDEGDAFLFQRLTEGRALGEKAVARMNGLGAGFLAGRDDPVGQEIGLVGRRGADMDGLVGHLHMFGVAVGIGIDGDGGDAHLLRRGDHPAGDLAAVGDEYLLERLGGHTSSTSLKASG